MPGWLTRWRRRRVLGRSRMDASVWQNCLARFPFLRTLEAAEQARLQDLVALFLHEKSIQGAGGMVITDDVRLAIAAQACLLILNLDLDYYRGWVEIIVYPDEFVVDHEYTDEDGIVHRVTMPLSGEAWEQGPVVLSWQDAATADGGFGYNVVMHEFAHKMDMLNGAPDGFPPLHSGMNQQGWTRAFSAAYADLRQRLDRGEETLVDPYAAEDPAEFFAVLSEMFFVASAAVHDRYPAIYDQLAAFYRQDPVRRAGARHG